MPHTWTPFLQTIGLQPVSVQPAPLHEQREPPLQSSLHEAAAVQSTSHVDFSEQETSTESPACTVTAQLLPPLQLALHVLAVAQVKRQSQPLLPQLKVQLAAPGQTSVQHGLHVVLQSDEQVDAASVVARSAPPPLFQPPGSLGSSGATAASVASSDEIGSPGRVKLHALVTTIMANHIQRIHL